MLIVDLDNCISHDQWRLGLIRWDTDNMFIRFHGYHAACVGDQPGNLHILTEPYVIFTARPETYRRHTEQWLRQHKLTPYAVHMRRDGDHRPSLIVKEEMTLKVIQHSITMAYDDRNDIVEMYQRHGIAATRLCLYEGGIDGKNGC